ncbi:hypothetical protein COOONC_03464 [Cooperia oncophora]
MLMEQVQALTQQAAQVRSSIYIIPAEVQGLQALPERVQENLWSGSSSRAVEKNRGDVAEAITELSCESHNIINDEVSNIDQLIVEILQFNDYNYEQMAAEQNEFYAQAQHDDKCMRELARLLQREQPMDVDTPSTSNVADFRTAMMQLPGYRERPTTATPRQNSQDRIPISSQFLPELSVGTTFAAMALPDVPIFSHPQGKGFETFVTSFHIKYGGLGLQDSMLIHLMCSKLQGYPKSVMETLPRSVREGTYANFIEALRVKLKENDSAQRTEVYIKLKQLRKLLGNRLLEELTRRAYQDASEKELSMIRAGELITQLTEWKERDCCKARDMRNKQLQTEQKLPVKSQEQGQIRSSINDQRKDTTRTQTFTTTLKRWSCKEIQDRPSAYNELFGKHTVTEVNLLGMSKLALLDTGSQVSIMPLRILLEAQEAGFDMDDNIEESPAPREKTIYDASGNQMEFKGAIRLTAELKNGQLHKVAMFVRKSDDDMIVFGTNALEKFNMTLKEESESVKSTFGQLRPRKDQLPRKSSSKEQKKAKADYRSARSAVVVQRVYIPPGETKAVAISIAETNTDQILWSNCEVIPDTVCNYDKSVVEIPVTNTLNQARLFRVGEKSRRRAAQEDPLHLFHPCTCNIFRTKAQTALPSLRSDLARSKPVNNMFELANVASIVLDPFWGDRRKGEELVAKESKHLLRLPLIDLAFMPRKRRINRARSVLGRSTQGRRTSCQGIETSPAIAAHRSSFYAFKTALRNAQGKRIVHPPLFPAFPGYHIDSYYAQALERLDQITKDYDDSPANPTIVALPLSFIRAEKDLEEDDKVSIEVYFAAECTLDLRGYRCGGTLDMYPPPYEERRCEMWHAVKRLCAEVVEVLTGPARGFDARVVDAYGTIDQMVSLGHPATSLGVSPRRGDDRFHPWQITVFLNQVRKFAMSTLSLPIFFAAKKNKRDAAADDATTSHDTTTKDEPQKKKAKILKPHVMYIRDAKEERNRQAPYMKQKRHKKMK